MDNVTNPPSNDSTVEEVNNVPLALLPLGVVFLVLGVSVKLPLPRGQGLAAG